MGTLTLLTLPIGNLGDMTERVLKALKGGEYFAVEDTRTFKNLLQQLGLSIENKKIYSYYDHSGPKVEEQLLSILREGHTLYLASEAGGPLISDPGYPLVQKALEEKHHLVSFPGVSAVLVALELSGLPPYPFHFHGFYPREKEKTEEATKKILGTDGTHIFFEAPTRVMVTLEKLTQSFPKAAFCVARELTKKFESIHRFKGEDFSEFKDQFVLKGEFTLLVHISRKQRNGRSIDNETLVKMAQEIYENGPKKKMVSKLLAEILGLPSKDIYEHWNKLDHETDAPDGPIK